MLCHKNIKLPMTKRTEIIFQIRFKRVTKRLTISLKWARRKIGN